MEFDRQENGINSANLIFEKTEMPPQEDMQVFIAFKKDGGLKRIQMTQLTNLTAAFEIPEGLEDCEISVYVWDKNMKPLMERQIFQ